MFRVQPQYGRDLWDTGPALATNLQDVQQTCKRAVDGLRKDSKNAQLLVGLSGKLSTPAAHIHCAYTNQAVIYVIHTKMEHTGNSMIQACYIS